jgi:hypothetical protein
MAENKQVFEGFIGPSYTGRSERFQAQRLVNYYLELDQVGYAKGGQKAVAIGTPGLELLHTVGAGPIRGLYTQSNDEISYIVSGNQVFSISASLSTPVLLSGNLNSSSGPVAITDNGLQVIIVDGTDGYYITIGTTTVTQIVDPNFFSTKTITFQDGYFIGVDYGTQAFFTSDINSINFPPLNETNAQGSPDVLVAAISNNRELYLLGSKSLEIWYNLGQSATTPFQRQDGRFSQIGCAAAASIAVIGETFFWLGSNAQGGGIVYALENALPTRISTHAVEYAIQQLGDISGATAYAYQQEGHLFYVLNIPGSPTTWVYDMSSGQWAERQSKVNGVTGRHLGENHCVLAGTHLVGDYRNGNVYRFNLDYNYDDTHSIPRIRQAPHLSASLNLNYYWLLEVDWQMGVGLQNDGVNPASSVDPRAVLEISRDGGETFTYVQYASLGKVGQYRYRARWRRLGSGRDLVFRVTLTEPVRATMLSAYIDWEQGQA